MDGSVLLCAQYDPISLTLRVIYNNGDEVDVPNVPISISSQLAAQPDPQAYLLALVAQQS